MTNVLIRDRREGTHAEEKALSDRDRGGHVPPQNAGSVT